MALVYRAKLGEVKAGRPEILKRPESASQTFLAGDLVFDDAGYVTVCGADPAKILGIALEDAHNDASDGDHSIDVLVLNANTYALMQVHHGTPANAVIEDTDEGAEFGIAVSSNVWYIDKEETSSLRVKIVKLFDSLGTLNGRVYAQVLTTVREID